MVARFLIGFPCGNRVVGATTRTALWWRKGRHGGLPYEGRIAIARMTCRQAERAATESVWKGKGDEGKDRWSTEE
jgi:hypothetical protein